MGFSFPSDGDGASPLKTLFIYLRLGTSHRNILRTEVIEALRSLPELRIVVVSPLGKEPYFREECRSKGLLVESLPKTRVGWLERGLKKLKLYLWSEREASATFKIKRRYEYSDGGRCWRDFLARALRRFGMTEEKINGWEIILFHSRKISRLYDRYHPDAVLFTKLFSTNIHMVKEAKKRGVKTICFVEGWDNLNSKGPLAVVPDHMIVWNEPMREEARELHGYPANQVQVVGVPEFDLYSNGALFRSREEFCREYNLDPNLKIVTYAVAGGAIAPREPEIIDLFYRELTAGRIHVPCQILLRLHPNTRGAYLKQFERFKNKPGIKIQPAGRVARIQDGWDPTWEDMIRLGETMLHSDVVCTIASTICLDAIALDTPVVGVGFEGEERNDYWRSYRRYYDFTHVNRVVKNEAVRVASSLREMVEWVNGYLLDPFLDAEGRKRVREQLIPDLDGKAGWRAGTAVLRAMGAGAARERESAGISGEDRTAGQSQGL